MPSLDELVTQVKRLSAELDKRIPRHEKLEKYIEGDCPFPPIIEQARLTKLYRNLMPVAEAPFGALVIDSKLDRLEVSAIDDQDKSAAEKVWGAWQDNAMDSESKLAHAAALLDGRCFATVWPNQDAPDAPDIALDDATQMIVQYASGSRKVRVAALRRWEENKRVYATLYRSDGVWKFQGPPDSASNRTTDEWEVRRVTDETWPLPNPLGVVPVVELAVNRRLKPGVFPYARGEFEHCIGLLDRINMLTFLGLLVALWMGFPVRGVIGEPLRREVLKDDDGNPLIDEDTGEPKEAIVPPAEWQPGATAQFEDPNVKTFEWGAADRKNLAVFPELDQLAVITKTPRHYFPLEQGMSNLSAEAIIASEGSMHAGVTGHKATLGEGWEEVLRLCGIVQGVKLSQRASLRWKDHTFRSLAEEADAAVKLASIPGIPWQVIVERALNGTQDDINRWEAFRSSGVLNTLLTAAAQPVTVAPNGNGLPAG